MLSICLNFHQNQARYAYKRYAYKKKNMYAILHPHLLYGLSIWGSTAYFKTYFKTKQSRPFAVDIVVTIYLLSILN